MTAPRAKASNGLRHALQEHTRATYREAILDAAERVFVRDGIQLAKMVDIAEATGVSVGTVYNYFESKESVFAALVERHRERYFSVLEEPMDTDDPIAGLLTVVRRSMRFVEENGVLFTIYLKSAYPSLEGVPRCMPTIDAEQDNARYCQRLAVWLERGAQLGKIRTDVPIDELVWLLHSVMHMLVMEWLHSPSKFSIADRAQSLVGLFLEGASSK